MVRRARFVHAYISDNGTAAGAAYLRGKNISTKATALSRMRRGVFLTLRIAGVKKNIFRISREYHRIWQPWWRYSIIRR